MRVTQSMLAQNSLRYLGQNYGKIGELQDQLATGKKITRASQDPVVAVNGIRYRTQSVEVEQFKRNLSEANSWLESTDSALDKTTQALQSIRELVVQASNDTYEEGQRDNIAKEVDQLIEHVASMANTKVNNKYIFNGTDTANPPVDLENVDSNGDIQVSNNHNEVIIEVMKGVEIPVNSDPATVFSKDLFNDLNDIKDALENENTTAEELTGYLEQVDTHINNVINERADIGARVNRMEMIETRLGEQEVIAERILSDNEDADMEKVIMDMMAQENVLRASLGAGARIMQPTLLDFLR